MNSRTQINGQDGAEVAALVYTQNTVEGDIYDATLMNNFAVYGRNLNLNTSAPSTWNLTNYTINPAAQSSYASDQKTYYTDRINQLMGEATEITDSSLTNGDWYLQAATLGDFNIKNATNSPDPEGKVWVYKKGGLTIGDNKTITYHGKGTIIIDSGDFSLGAFSTLKAGAGSSLGIIVINTGASDGKMWLGRGSLIQAAVFASRSIEKRDAGSVQNIQAIGSFVASGFNFPASSNVSFRYDFHLSGNWPPGFRYFYMPVASEN
jgi:hypothetical protein